MGLSLGIGLGVTRRTGGAAAWTPASLAAIVTTLLTAEARAGAGLWQDTAKTVASDDDGDPVRVSVCPYTAEEFAGPSDATRPLLWDEGDGGWSSYFDGVDDYLDGTSHTLSGAWTCGVSLNGDDLGSKAIFGNLIGACGILTSGDRLIVRSDAGRSWTSPIGVMPADTDLTVIVEWDGLGGLSVSVNGVTITPSTNTLTASESFTFRAVGYNVGAGTIGARLRGLLLAEETGFSVQLAAYLSSLTP